MRYLPSKWQGSCLRLSLCPGAGPGMGGAGGGKGLGEGAQGASAHLSHSVTGFLFLVPGREWDVEEEDTGPRPTWLKPPDQGPGGHGAAADITGEWHTGAGGTRAGVHPGRL